MTRFGIDPSRSEEMRSIRDTDYVDLLRNHACWFGGAQALLESLLGKISLGLVTGSWKIYVDEVDARLNFLRYFDTVVTEDRMGGAGFPKPHPHGLLLATKELGVAPKHCVYIGDMTTDVECAHRAGMQSFIINGTFTAKEALQQSDRSFASLRELHAALRQELS
ncbi:hypothetical protein AUJ46_03465 [Candidatus Peregrinibacteria bacterium CG1_02_54_53]|nr:MAG: hypothetical protein AUJ46_03465 [Candidatus Peregrinibacteria bacterium CG1_02_54_53]